MNPETSRTPDRCSLRRGGRCVVVTVVAALTVVAAGLSQEQAGTAPVQVAIKDEQAVVVEAVLPVDPVRRINYQPQGLVPYVRTEDNRTLHLSVTPSVHVDGQVHYQGQGGVQVFMNQPLGKTKDGREQDGFTTQFKYGDLIITSISTVVATKPSDKSGKRRRDSMLTRYVIENKGTQARKFGLRVFMDTYVIDNDGCLFAAPNFPNKILNGVELKGKEFPPYVQLLQRPDLANPGFVAHLTFDLGAKFEKPDRIVLTRLGAQNGAWDVTAQQAGDSALAFFWEPKEIKPGGKREFAYGYGQGLVTSPESEGRVNLVLGGSFAPGKLFSVSAYVSDPGPGQSLALELPAGMALVEGKEVQPVPPAREGELTSLVYWRARVLRAGEFPVRVRSSTGVTQGKVISITAGKR